MRRLTYIFIVSFLMLCCKNQTTSKKEDTRINQTKQNVLTNEIADKLDLYIKEYPLPNKTENYYYQISIENDYFSLIRISFPDPEELEFELKGFFFYKDSVLVSIKDRKEKITSNYYASNLFVDKLEEKLFPRDRIPEFDESFPPIWKYKINNDKAILVDIDTIWKNWK